ncbi:sulfatase-like hydrolase/transferase [Persicobacter diffluens]
MKYLSLTLTLFSVALAGLCKPRVKTEDQRPNLLFIMTDQQRFDALGRAGKFDFLQTPHLDQLANEGAYFTKAYTPCAVCAPARASILTGQTVENHGIRRNDYAYFDPKEGSYCDEPTFDQVLVERGYYAEYWGKFHSPLKLASPYSTFDYSVNSEGRYTLEDRKQFVALMKQAAEHYQPQSHELKDPFFLNYYSPDPIDLRYGKAADFRRKRSDGTFMPLIQPDNHGKLNIPAEKSLTAFQTQQAIAALERAAAQEKPFSITLSYFFPHAPMLPTAPWYGMYPPEEMPIPESLEDPMTDSPYLRENGRDLMPEYRDPEKIKYMMSNYFGLISEVDHYIGKLMLALDSLGFADNTLIIFTSDHGEMLGSHGMREKNVFYEESAHIPLIVWYPQKIKPVVVNSPISLIDLYPTIMDYLHMDGGKRDGLSLKGLIEKSPAAERSYVVTEWDFHGPVQPNYMVVADGWKLMTSYAENRPDLDVLYHLKDDPHEIHNLMKGPDRAVYREKVAELKAYLVEWLQEKGSKRTGIISSKKLSMHLEQPDGPPAFRQSHEVLKGKR